MIVYFKAMNNLLMVLGAAIGAAIGYFTLDGHILDHPSRVGVFLFAMWVFGGIIVFRVIASVIATQKLKKIQAKLYKDTDPRGYLDDFEKLNSRIPHNLAEYANGQNSISFAKEALGDFDGALEAIKDLKPEEQKMHALTTSALIVNQKANLWILKKDFLASQDQIDDLRHLEELAEKRAKMLATNLAQQIKLHETRISAARGDADTDIKYLTEEVELSTNIIHKKEMQLELAEYYLRNDKKDEALPILQDIVKTSYGLYSETRAKELIDNPDSYFRYHEKIKDESGAEIGRVDTDGFVVIRE